MCSRLLKPLCKLDAYSLEQNLLATDGDLDDEPSKPRRVSAGTRRSARRSTGLLASTCAGSGSRRFSRSSAPSSTIRNTTTRNSATSLESPRRHLGLVARVAPQPRSGLCRDGGWIQSDQVVLIGPICQELLSGIRFEEQFSKLQDRLRAFPDMLLRTEDYELAARCFNRCRLAASRDRTPTFLFALSRYLERYRCTPLTVTSTHPPALLGVALHVPGD